MIEPRLLKGFADFGSKESLFRESVFSKIKSVFIEYGFLPLETPTLEYKDILLNKYGEDEKLVYSFTDHGGREVALRYDLTVPMARYVAMHINELPLPFKRFQIQPVWRADNTQRGRSREFYQCDIDIVGSDTEVGEIEALSCLLTALSSIGLTSSVAHVSDRRLYDGFARQLSGGTEQLVPLMRMVDKVHKKNDEELLAEAKEKYAFTDSDCTVLSKVLQFIRRKPQFEEITDLVAVDPLVFQYVQTIFSSLKSLGFGDRVVFDLAISRGLDYYSGVVWEFFSDNSGTLAIGSGGRYDGLISSFGQKEVPAVGGSLGITRILEIAMQDHEKQAPVQCLILNVERDFASEYLQLAQQLRTAHITTDVYHKPDKLDKQFKYAEKVGIPYALVFGRAEKEKQIIQIKEIQNRTQKEVSLVDIVSVLKNA